MIRKWKQPLSGRVNNIEQYLASKGYDVMLGFIDLSTGEKVKHIKLVESKFENHKELDIVYRPNYTFSLNQSPCLEVYYKKLSSRYSI